MGNRKLLLIVGGLVLLLIIVGAAAYAMGQKKDNTASQTDTSGNKQALSTPEARTGTSNYREQYTDVCSTTAKPVFSHSPLALDKMGGITPLGQVSDGHVTPTDHVYVSPINASVADNTYDVVMPADGKVVDIGRMPAQYVGDRKDVTVAQDDFRMTVSHSCKYFSIFIHLHKLSPALTTAIGDLPAGQTKKVNVDLKAGELIAHIGGSSFDWTLLDTDSELKGFISPELYSSESWKIHTISPFDVYTGDLKAQLEAKSLRTVAPLGGKIDYDKAGALVGNWFKEKTNGYTGASQERYYDGHLSIAPNHIDPTGITYSTGNWSGNAKQFTVKGTFDPATITKASGATKIELVASSYTLANGGPFTGGAFQKGMKLVTTGSTVGTVLVQVLDGEKLKLEQFPGKTADQVTGFTSAALTYER